MTIESTPNSLCNFFQVFSGWTISLWVHKWCAVRDAFIINQTQIRAVRLRWRDWQFQEDTSLNKPRRGNLERNLRLALCVCEYLRKKKKTRYTEIRVEANSRERKQKYSLCAVHDCYMYCRFTGQACGRRLQQQSKVVSRQWHVKRTRESVGSSS